MGRGTTRCPYNFWSSTVSLPFFCTGTKPCSFLTWRRDLDGNIKCSGGRNFNAETRNPERTSRVAFHLKHILQLFHSWTQPPGSRASDTSFLFILHSYVQLSFINTFEQSVLKCESHLNNTHCYRDGLRLYFGRTGRLMLPLPILEMINGQWCNDWRENRTTRRKTCLSNTSSILIPP